MRQRDLAGDGQPEADPGAWIGAPVALEDMLQLVARDARPVVDDRDDREGVAGRPRPRPLRRFRRGRAGSRCATGWSAPGRLSPHPPHTASSPARIRIARPVPRRRARVPRRRPLARAPSGRSVAGRWCGPGLGHRPVGRPPPHGAGTRPPWSGPTPPGSPARSARGARAARPHWSSAPTAGYAARDSPLRSAHVAGRPPAPAGPACRRSSPPASAPRAGRWSGRSAG